MNIFRPALMTVVVLFLGLSWVQSEIAFGADRKDQATAPVIGVSRSSLSFGNVTVGERKTLTPSLSNTGTDTLFVSALTLTISGTDTSQFSASLSYPYKIPPGRSNTILVSFKPTTTGDKTATLTIQHNNAPTATSKTVSLTAKGDKFPVPQLSPDPLSFLHVLVRRTKSLTLTVTNLDTSSSVSVTGITSGDPVFTVSPTQLTLPPGGNATTTVTFKPTELIRTDTTVTLTYNTDKGTGTVTARMGGWGTRSSYR